MSNSEKRKQRKAGTLRDYWYVNWHFGSAKRRKRNAARKVRRNRVRDMWRASFEPESVDA